LAFLAALNTLFGSGLAVLAAHKAPFMEFCPPKSYLTSAGFLFSSYITRGAGFLEGVAWWRTVFRALTSEALVSPSLILDKKGD
jgi:hypothetical protein